MDAAASGPSSWFFQLYNVDLHTPSLSATACALSCRLQSPMTPACFNASGYIGRAALPTMAFLSSGSASRTHAVNVHDQLTIGRPDAFAELDLQLNRSNPVFVWIHKLPPGSPSFSASLGASCPAEVAREPDGPKAEIKRCAASHARDRLFALDGEKARRIAYLGPILQHKSVDRFARYCLK